MSFKAEVLVSGIWNSNAVRWPDMGSAEAAAADLFRRWTATADHRAIEVADEPPNRPTWKAWVSQRLHADSLVDHLAPTGPDNDV